MFVFVYINTNESISIIQGKSLSKINKGITKAVQEDDLWSENMEQSENWEIFEMKEGKLVPYTNYCFASVMQFI